MTTYEDEERRSRGVVIDVRNPLHNPLAPARPKLYAPLVPPRPQDVADREQAEQLAARLIATLPDAMRRALDQARVASQDADRVWHAGQAAASAPLPGDDAPVEELAATMALREAHAVRVTALGERARVAGAAYVAALASARQHILWVSGRAILDAQRQQNQIRQAAAERLEADAAHGRIVLMNAESLVNASLLTSPAAVAVEPPARGLFGRGK